MLYAITREVSPAINDCELTFHPKQQIDVAKAVEQHGDYKERLASLGVRVISLPAEPNLPDSVFVEDTAVVVDELAVITRMGALSRRPETASVSDALSRYKRLEFLSAPATLDGGDVMQTGRKIFAGLSGRTNSEGIAQLRLILEPFGYEIIEVEVRGCLHLKSACSYIGRNSVLINPRWIDRARLEEFELIQVPDEERWAANALLINETVIISSAFPQTKSMLAGLGFQVETLDVSELQKAEGALTCTSIIFNNHG